MQYIVLGLLRRGEAQHGYALVKEYRLRTGFRISIGHAYRELQRLLSRGWVQTATNPPGADPRRLPYGITAAGAAAFDSWLAGHASVVPAECHDALAIRAFFLSEGSSARTKEIFDLWREELSVHRQLCEHSRDEACRRENPDGMQSPLALLLGRRLQHITADIAFVEALRSSCRAEREPTSVGTRGAAPRARSSATVNDKRPSLG